MLRLKRIWASEKRLVKSTKFISFSIFPMSLTNVMIMTMNFLRSQFKIYNSIIIKNTIDMMNYFFRFKISTKFLFHYQSMFHYITMAVSKWMIFRKDLYIPISFSSSSFPSIMIFTIRNIFNKQFNRAFSRTNKIFFIFDLTRESFNSFTTNRTFFNNHSPIVAIGQRGVK